MDVTKHRVSDGVICLAVTGELDMATTGALHEAITSALADGGVAELLVELSALSFCDACGINALLTGRASATAAGSTYRVINPQGLVRRILSYTGTLDLLTGAPHKQFTARGEHWSRPADVLAGPGLASPTGWLLNQRAQAEPP